MRPPHARERGQGKHGNHRAGPDVRFALLPSTPPITAPLAALTRYTASHHHAMLAAAWLEGTGTLLQVIFILALACVADARAGRAGRFATVACAAALGITLAYHVMLIAIAQSAELSHPRTTAAVVAYGLFAAVEHVFLIAPPLLLPLGLILVRTPLLPRSFAWVAVLLGALGNGGRPARPSRHWQQSRSSGRRGQARNTRGPAG